MKPTNRFVRSFAFFLALGLLVVLVFPFATRLSRAEQLTAASGPVIKGLKGVQEGQTLTGKVAIEALVDGATKVIFRVGGPATLDNTEYQKPYFFLGDKGGVPNGWDTTKYPNGDYTLTVTASDSATWQSILAVHFRVANGGQPQPTTSPTTTPLPQTATRPLTTTPLPPTATRTSTVTPLPPTATRTSTVTPLPPSATPGGSGPVIKGLNGVQEGQTAAGTIAIEALVDGAAKVAFQLTGPATLNFTEYQKPYFFLGDKGGVPNGWDTTKYPNGDYTLTVTASDTAGRQSVLTVRFHVANGGQPQPTPTTVPGTPIVTPPPTPEPSTGTPVLLFGIGPEANDARETRLAQETPLWMLTSWYNGPKDLDWMSYWKDGLVPESYRDGYALHLIVFTDGQESAFSTAYGTACGRPYPFSATFLDDMRQLAQIFAGTADGPPLYVTLFTEFQTYACTDNAWNPNAQTNAYWKAMKDRYRETMTVFHQNAPNARVSLGWGGWQARFDNPSTGSGRSMFQYFADVMQESDFQSFQAMQSDTNVEDMRNMVNTLNDYGLVMLAHYKPDNGSQSTFDADVHAMLTDSYLAEMTGAGLFAWSFMDNKNLSASESIYQFTKSAVQRYGRTP